MQWCNLLFGPKRFTSLKSKEKLVDQSFSASETCEPRCIYCADSCSCVYPYCSYSIRPLYQPVNMSSKPSWRQNWYLLGALILLYDFAYNPVHRSSKPSWRCTKPRRDRSCAPLQPNWRRHERGFCTSPSTCGPRRRRPTQTSI